MRIVGDSNTPFEFVKTDTAEIKMDFSQPIRLLSSKKQDNEEYWIDKLKELYKLN